MLAIPKVRCDLKTPNWFGDRNRNTAGSIGVGVSRVFLWQDSLPLQWYAVSNLAVCFHWLPVVYLEGLEGSRSCRVRDPSSRGYVAHRLAASCMTVGQCLVIRVHIGVALVGLRAWEIVISLTASAIHCVLFVSWVLSPSLSFVDIEVHVVVALILRLLVQRLPLSSCGITLATRVSSLRLSCWLSPIPGRRAPGSPCFGHLSELAFSKVSYRSVLHCVLDFILEYRSPPQALIFLSKLGLHVEFGLSI